MRRDTSGLGHGGDGFDVRSQCGNASSIPSLFLLSVSRDMQGLDKQPQQSAQICFCRGGGHGQSFISQIYAWSTGRMWHETGITVKYCKPHVVLKLPVATQQRRLVF